MNKMTEDEIVAYLYNCVPLPENITVTDNEIVKFLKYESELPSKYNIIKRELIFIRNNFKSIINYLSHIYLLKIVTIFLTFKLNGNYLPRKYISFLIDTFCYGSFRGILELSNYFVFVYMPDKLNLMTLDKRRSNSLASVYVDVCCKLYTNLGSGFKNNEISEILTFLNDYPLRDQSYADIGEMIIGFYHLNHERFNLNLDDLSNALDNRMHTNIHMDVNKIEFDNLSDEIILSFFHQHKSLKKIT